MPAQTVGAPAPKTTVVEPHKRDWNIVRWGHKVADSVSSKFKEESTIGKWLGRFAFIVLVPAAIIPSLLGDAAYFIRTKIQDRSVEKKETVDKKVPTQAQFEALQKQVSVEKARVKQAQLEKRDIHNHAVSQENAFSKLLHEAEVAPKREIAAQQAELEAQADKVKALEDARNCDAVEIGHLKAGLQDHSELAVWLLWNLYNANCFNHGYLDAAAAGQSILGQPPGLDNRSHAGHREEADCDVLSPMHKAEGGGEDEFGLLTQPSSIVIEGTSKLADQREPAFGETGTYVESKGRAPEDSV